jgi:hypothetical protein
MIHDTLKSGKFTAGLGRQFIREMGKKENVVVTVTSLLLIEPVHA